MIASSLLSSEWALLDSTLALWLLLISLVVVSPLFSLLRDAGTYGKLHHHAQQKSSKEKDDAKPAPVSGLNKILLHPCLYVKTSIAFPCYYALASIWNAWLLFEAAVSDTSHLRCGCELY